MNKIKLKTESDLYKSLIKLKSDVRSGDFEKGIKNSIIKWETLIAWASEHDKIPDMSIYWDSCGLCVASDSYCSRCPLFSRKCDCRDFPGFRRYTYPSDYWSKAKTPAEWVNLATKFLNWIKFRTKNG